MTPQQISDRELRKAAVHEAAHAVLARFLGYPATAEVFATPDPGPDDKLWIGRTGLRQPITAKDSRLIALAGTVAEQIDNTHGVTALDIADRLEHGDVVLSGTDAQMAGDYTTEDLDGTLLLVRHCWEEIEPEARRLEGGGAGMSAMTPIRHSGIIAAGVVVQFIYDPATGELGSVLTGDPRLHPRGDVLRRYRAVRHEFFERVASIIGGRVAVLEADEDGNSDGLYVIDEPKAGHA